MKERIELAANISMLVAAATATVFLVNRMMMAHARETPPISAYQVNETLPDAVPVDVSNARQTLVLVLNSRCSFCQASLPFYRRIDRSRKADVKLVVAGREPEAILASYVKENGVRADAVVSINGVLRPTPTPTIILVSRDRQILGSWAGQLEPAREREVLAALAKP